MVFPRLEITLGFLFQSREWCFQDWKLHWDLFSNLGNGVSKIGNYIGISFPISGMVFPRLKLHWDFFSNLGNGVSKIEITLGFLFQSREWCFQDWKLHWDFFSNLGNGLSKIENYIGISFPISGMEFPRLQITLGFLFQSWEWCYQDRECMCFQQHNPNIGNGVSGQDWNSYGNCNPIIGKCISKVVTT